MDTVQLCITRKEASRLSGLIYNIPDLDDLYGQLTGRADPVADEVRRIANGVLAADECLIEDDSRYLEADGGVWVQAWCWLDDEDSIEFINDTTKEQMPVITGFAPSGSQPSTSVPGGFLPSYADDDSELAAWKQELAELGEEYAESTDDIIDNEYKLRWDIITETLEFYCNLTGHDVKRTMEKDAEAVLVDLVTDLLIYCDGEILSFNGIADKADANSQELIKAAECNISIPTSMVS